MSQSISLYNQLANHKLFNKNINFNLKRIKLVLKKLNHPEKLLGNVINFLGSSGKFSTLFSVKSFIEANGQTVTAYVSPSLKNIKERAQEHKNTIMIGRSHGIHAEPITFGIKLASYYCEFKRHLSRLKMAKKDALIMHPGPMNRGVEIDTSLADDINRSVIREQVELGVAVRMACLKLFCKSV